MPGRFRAMQLTCPLYVFTTMSMGKTIELRSTPFLQIPTLIAWQCCLEKVDHARCKELRRRTGRRSSLMEQTASPGWHQGSGGTKNSARVVEKLNDPKVVRQQGYFRNQKKLHFIAFFFKKASCQKHFKTSRLDFSFEKIIDWTNSKKWRLDLEKLLVTQSTGFESIHQGLLNKQAWLC